MRSLLDADEVEEKNSEHTEINLSAASLLGMFVGLVLICGVFFGLGYSVGRRSAPSSEPAASTTAENSEAPKTIVQETVAQTAKPAPSETSPAPATAATPAVVSAQPQAATVPPAPAASAVQAPSIDLPIDETPPPQVKPNSGRKPSAAAPKPAAYPTANSPATVATPATAAAPTPAQAQPGSGDTMVQVAAVAHQEDAQVLVNALRQHGYNAVIRSEPQDHLLRVQVGPYATRAQAQEMRQKLISDGYNAIVK
jgi:cell division protein FtsN